MIWEEKGFFHQEAFIMKVINDEDSYVVFWWSESQPVKGSKMLSVKHLPGQ